MNRKEFGKLLKALRLERDDPDTGLPLDQTRLDELCKFPKGCVGRIERGELKVLDEDMLLKLAHALDLTRMERKEFLFAANGVANSNTYPRRDVEAEWQHITDVLRNIHLPCFVNDVFGDVIATNSLMTDILNVTNELRAYGLQNPAAYNVLFFIMWPGTGFLKMLQTAPDWKDLITSNVQWYRRMSLRYRTSPYWQQLMDTLRRHPDQEFRKTFAHYWERAQISDDLDGNMDRQYRYTHPKYGRLNYIATVAEETFSSGEVHYVTYAPADLPTYEVFHDLARKHAERTEGITVERFAQWPKPME